MFNLFVGLIDEFREAYDNNPNDPRVQAITNDKPDRQLGVATNYSFEALQPDKAKGKQLYDENGNKMIGGQGTILGDSPQIKYLNDIRDSNSIGTKGHGITITDMNDNAVIERVLTSVNGKEYKYIDIHAGGSGASKGCATKTTLGCNKSNHKIVTNELKKLLPSLNDKNEKTYIYLPKVND